MVFLFIRILPFIIPLSYILSAKALFYFSDYWLLIAVAQSILLAVWFGLLKRKDPEKPLLLLFIYGLIYGLSGLAYLAILESAWIINLFLLAWAFVFWLYLEAVFHDFYKTDKTYILNLQNISLYCNILIVFFLTAALVNFSIFFNWPWLLLLPGVFLVYLPISYAAFLRQGLSLKKSQVFAVALSLIMIQLLGAQMLWPVSFYVIALISSLVYYLLLSLSFFWINKTLDAKAAIKYVLFSTALAIVVLISARWF